MYSQENATPQDLSPCNIKTVNNRITIRLDSSTNEQLSIYIETLKKQSTLPELVKPSNVARLLLKEILKEKLATK